MPAPPFGALQRRAVACVSCGRHRTIARASAGRRAAGGLLAATLTLSSAVPALADITPVYFGNGCFWGRQKDYVDTEQKLGRTPDQSTALVGYAGGRENSKPTCYYYNSPDTLYEKQGHAEVVQVGLDSSKAKDEMAMFAETYFGQFKKTPRGMMRSDPQDKGAGYRNVVGIPGGVDSELYKVFASKNKDNMKLVPGKGNEFRNGRATEDDTFNTVYIVDTENLPFHQAEAYHQYHNGMGAAFPKEYLVGLKNTKKGQGVVTNIPGCMEYPF